MSLPEPTYRPRLSRSVKVLRRWQPVLADQMDGADQHVAQAQRRLPDLAARVTAPSRACRGSLERMILPGAALYLTLGAYIDRERALSVTGACIASDAERQAGLLDRTPWLFPIVRYLSVRWIRTRFVPPAWEAHLLEDTQQRVRFDITRCYYLDTLRTLGIPELTARYCHVDDVIYRGHRHLDFRRAGTLGLGYDRCDFCYERRTGSHRQRRPATSGRLAPRG